MKEIQQGYAVGTKIFVLLLFVFLPLAWNISHEKEVKISPVGLNQHQTYGDFKQPVTWSGLFIAAQPVVQRMFQYKRQ